MVDLPSTRQGRIILTEAPRSSVSGSDISSAFDKLGRGLDVIGDNLQAAKNEQAALEGQNAVYRDADGTLKYTTRPSFSQSGRLFNRSARTAYLAQVAGDVRQGALDLRMKSQGDVKAFEDAYTGFRQSYLDKADPLMEGPLKQVLDEEFARTREGLMQDQMKRDVDNNKAAILNEIDRLGNEMGALAASGGTGTADYATKQQSVRTLYSQLTDNPLFDVSPADAEQAMRRLESAHKAEFIAGQTQRIFETQGLKAAEDFAQKSLWDTKLDLTPSERRTFEGIATAGIRQITADRRAELKEVKANAAIMRESFTKGVAVPDSEVDDVAKQLAALGSPGEALKLLRSQRVFNVLRDFSAKSDGEQAAELRGLTGGKALVDRIVGVESGNRGDAKNPRSTAAGWGQFTDGTWLATVKKYEPELMAGKSREQVLALRSNEAISRRMVGHYMNENAAALGAAGFEATDGNLYLAHFAGAGGAVALLSADEGADAATVMAAAGGTTAEKILEANPFLEGMTAQDVAAWASRKMGANLDPEVYQEMQKEVVSDAKRLWGEIKAGLKKGDGLDPADAALLSDQLALTKDKDFENEVRAFLVDSGLPDFLAARPVAQEQDLTRMEADGLSAAEREVFDTKKAIHEQTVTGLKDDPIGLAVQRKVVPDPGPIEWGNGQQIADSLAKRQKAVNVTQQYYGRPNMPALRPTEIEAFKAQWSSAAPPQKAALIGTLAGNLEPETFRATMTAIAGKDDGMPIAMAGMLYLEDAGLGADVIRGLDLLTTNKKLGWDSSKDSLGYVVGTDGDPGAFPRAAFAPGMEQQRQAILTAVRAKYAVMSEAANDASGVLNEDRLTASIDAVTGGMAEWNDEPVLPPVRGMPQPVFDTLMSSLTDADTAAAIFSDGTPVTADAIREQGVLQAVADGRYIVRFGGPEGGYAMTAAGLPFVLDLKRKYEGRNP